VREQVVHAASLQKNDLACLPDLLWPTCPNASNAPTRIIFLISAALAPERRQKSAGANDEGHQGQKDDGQLGMDV